MFAKAGPSGEPIATPSICRCMLLLKLNSTEEVASCINWTKMLRGKDGVIKSSKGVSADFSGFRKRNIGEETGNVKRTKKDKGRKKSKYSDSFYKGKRIKHTIRRFWRTG